MLCPAHPWSKLKVFCNNKCFHGSDWFVQFLLKGKPKQTNQKPWHTVWWLNKILKLNVKSLELKDCCVQLSLVCFARQQDPAAVLAITLFYTDQAIHPHPRSQQDIYNSNQQRQGAPRQRGEAKAAKVATTIVPLLTLATSSPCVAPAPAV